MLEARSAGQAAGQAGGPAWTTMRAGGCAAVGGGVSARVGGRAGEDELALVCRRAGRAGADKCVDARGRAVCGRRVTWR